MKKLSFLFAALVTALTMSANEVTVSIADYATANHWENSKQYTSLVMDEAVSVTAEPTTGDYNNTGRYYTNGNNWRMYQNEKPVITVIAADGFLLTSVTFTYEVKNTGVLIDADSTQILSNEAYGLDNVSSVVFSVGNTGTVTNGTVQISKITVTYEKDPNAVFYSVTATVNDEKMGSVSGAGEYLENKEVTLKATANPSYEFVKWSNESTESSLKFVLTQDTTFTATFQALTPITIAEANVLEDGKKLLLNPFVVTQVQGGNTYIKDETGYSVLFKYDFGLVAGDTVSGLLGSKTTYKYHQIVPSVEKADLTIKSGEVPQPEEFTTAPILADLYKYVKLDTVTVKSGALVLKDSTSIQYYNATLTDGKKYNIVGSVGHYNGTLQIIVATNDLLPGQEDTETPGEGEQPSEGDTLLTKVTFDFTTAEGLEALGIAYPVTDAGNGALATNLEEGKTYTQEGVSLTAKHGITATRVWLSASGAINLRHYKNGVLTFTAPVAKVITNIVFDGGDLTGLTTLTDNAWTGSASSVDIPADAYAKTIKINSITVTLADASEDYVEAPAIADETNFLDSTTVTITAAEGLKVYYTLDGTEPTNASTEYTAPFELTATTTVKAIAYNGDKASAVVEKTFTKMSILTCAEAVALCTPTATTENYIIRGYVTEMIEAYNPDFKNMTFWMADTQDGGQVLQAFRVKPVSEVEKGLQVGDFVEVTGTLVLYSKDNVNTPEVIAGSSVKLLQTVKILSISIKCNIPHEWLYFGVSSAKYLDKVGLSVNPNYGYHFVQWSDGVKDNPRTLVVTQDTVLTVELAPNKYTISTTSSQLERGTTQGDTTLNYLEYATIFAEANYGYHFENWNDGNTENPRKVHVWRDEIYTAYFEKETYSVITNYNSEQGYIDGVSSAKYLDRVTLTAMPKLGYEFVRWSDGNTSNPRIFTLTQDTAFTAEFAQSFSGKCGDQLYWSYDQSNNSISISGRGKMYDYTATTQPWLLFQKNIMEVITSNKTLTIGKSAFEGCIRLAKLTLGSEVEEIGENAFVGCTRLYDIYSYPTYPPFAEVSSFANYEVYLYIPCEGARDYKLDLVWKKFMTIDCIGAETGEVEADSVKVEPSTNSVTITWPTDENADTYSIEIKRGDVVFCTLTFSKDGMLTNIAFAPSRSGSHPVTYAASTGNGLRFTVTSLDAATTYGYDITTKDEEEKILSTYTGEFTTKSNVTTDMDNISSPATTCQKLLRNGQLVILRDGKTYNAMGVEM